MEQRVVPSEKASICRTVFCRQDPRRGSGSRDIAVVVDSAEESAAPGSAGWSSGVRAGCAGGIEVAELANAVVYAAVMGEFVEDDAPPPSIEGAAGDDVSPVRSAGAVIDTPEADESLEPAAGANKESLCCELWNGVAEKPGTTEDSEG